MEAISSWKLSKKLGVALGIIILVFIGSGIFSNLNLKKLGKLQDDGAQRFTDSQRVADVLIRMESFYAIVGDAIINRNLSETQKDLAEFKKQAEADMKTIHELTDTPEEKKQAADFEKAYRLYIETFETKLIPVLEKTSAIDQSVRDIDGMIDGIRENTRKPLKAIANSIQNESKEGDKTFDMIFQSTQKWTLAISIVGVILAFAIALILSKSLTSSLRSVTQILSGGSAEVTQASQELAEAAQSLSTASTEAAASIEETVASLEQLSNIVSLNANNSKGAATLSQESTKIAEAGDKEMAQLVAAMNEISESSKKMSDIITVIDDIAFQTNLLALNASVEAARAGEQGKGFAVVAEAVRSLAQRSANSAKEIDSIIKDSANKIKNGTEIASKSRDTLISIVNAIKKSNDLNSEIALASTEQSHSLEQINKAMVQLDQATQTNAAAAEEAAATSQELSSQSEILHKTVVVLTEIVEGRQT